MRSPALTPIAVSFAVALAALPSDGVAQSIFLDGFERGAACTWSATAPSAPFSRCLIGQQSWCAGDRNPANDCQACAPAQSTNSWTTLANGTLCEDGLSCTSNETCTAGFCSGVVSQCTPPGLTGSLLVEGSSTQLVDPRAIVVSARDSHLYVADLAQVGSCNPSCIWRIDAATGAIDPTPVVVGTGIIEGIAVDATSDHLFFSDRQDRVVRLTWNGTAYAGPALCDDVGQQSPGNPIHLVVDTTLGLLVADTSSQQLIRIATCSPSSVGTAFSTGGSFDTPRGVALGPNGEIYVSDTPADLVAILDRVTGAKSTFQGQISGAYGMEWLAGSSAYANSLLVAASADRTVFATQGSGTTGVVFMLNRPIDVALAGGTLYVLTSPSNGNHGRIYKVTGF